MALTLLVRQICKLVCCAGVAKRQALAIIPILQNHAQTIKLGHQDLYDTGLQVGESTFAARLTTNVQEHRSTGLIVRVIEEVPLLEGVGCVWLVA